MLLWHPCPLARFGDFVLTTSNEGQGACFFSLTFLLLSPREATYFPPEGWRPTIRERLASLTRKCRHAAARLETLEKGMYLIGCTYNFCFPHHQLSKSIHFGCPTTPAMAAGLTDHIWSIQELLCYKIAPAVWIEPKRRGRPRKETALDTSAPKRARGRPRKIA